MTDREFFDPAMSARVVAAAGVRHQATVTPTVKPPMSAARSARLRETVRGLLVIVCLIALAAMLGLNQ